jgi:hypothetical protein
MTWPEPCVRRSPKLAGVPLPSAVFLFTRENCLLRVVRLASSPRPDAGSDTRTSSHGYADNGGRLRPGHTPEAAKPSPAEAWPSGRKRRDDAT